MSAMPGRRVKLDALTEENEALRHSLGYRFQTVEEWEKMIPQHLRDAFAARALIAANGDGYRAACRLGFGKVGPNFPKDVLASIFLTDGVREILERDLSQPEQNKAAMIERMVQFALYGEEGNSIRAMQVLAKMCGWIRTPDVLVQNNRQTILALVTQKNHRGYTDKHLDLGDDQPDIPAFLEHEPGAAVRIDSGQHVALAQGDDEE